MTEILSIRSDTIVSQSKATLSSSIDSETVLLSVSKSSYYGMGTVASHIWRLLDQPIQVRDLVQILLQEYEATHSECEQDVISFLQELRTENLIDIYNR